MESLEPVDAGGEELLVAAVRWPEYVEGVSNLAHKIVDLTDTRALVLLVEMDGRVFAVVRSRTERIDAAVLAAALGGGGHAQAASAIARDELDESRARPCSPRSRPRARAPSRTGRHVDAGTRRRSRRAPSETR